MKLKSLALSCLVALTFVGCNKDNSAANEEKQQRSQPLMEEAMRAEQEGATDTAITLYRRALRSDGTNAMAHFNLALLLHDRKKDYVGALYHYQEYLDLQPNSEKAQTVTEQITIVQSLLAETLAQDIVSRRRRELEAEYSTLRNELTETEVELAKVRKELAQKDDTIAELERKLSRLESLIEAMKADEEERRVQYNADVERARQLATTVGTPADDEADTSIAAIRDLATTMIEEDDGGQKARNEAARAAAEGKTDEELIAATPTAGKKYVVRPGDTLSRLAREAYGDAAQWPKIRDANRSTTNPNWRLRAGETILIP